mmetsp:Transcript_40474/g.102924  ORF Transcript_40474/g.102924 Transcript_40474/m.102924 type:complete len:224 (-) Transcript_40474:81-752(-)
MLLDVVPQSSCLGDSSIPHLHQRSSCPSGHDQLHLADAQRAVPAAAVPYQPPRVLPPAGQGTWPRHRGGQLDCLGHLLDTEHGLQLLAALSDLFVRVHSLGHGLQLLRACIHAPGSPSGLRQGLAAWTSRSLQSEERQGALISESISWRWSSRRASSCSREPADRGWTVLRSIGRAQCCRQLAFRHHACVDSLQCQSSSSSPGLIALGSSDGNQIGLCFLSAA